MKIIKKLLLILVFLLLSGGLWFYLEHSLPSNESVKQEFLKQNSNFEEVEFISVSLIFEQVEKDVLTYLVKFKEPNSNEIKMHGLSVKQDWNFQWSWCDDQTERKCD
jgi:hypothetical protein